MTIYDVILSSVWSKSFPGHQKIGFTNLTVLVIFRLHFPFKYEVKYQSFFAKIRYLMETDQVKIINENDNPTCNICLILTIHDNENNNIKTWFFSDRLDCLLKSRIFVVQKTAARND